MHIEEIDKPACSETICSEGITLKEQCTCTSSLVCSHQYLVIFHLVSIVVLSYNVFIYTAGTD